MTLRSIAPVTEHFNRFAGRTLADLTTEPEGMVRGSFTRNGRDIATLYAPATTDGPARGDVVFLPGYGSSVFYHYHAIRELQAAGYNVHGMDWFGQGQSERADPRHPDRPATDGFDQHLADLDAFINTQVLPVAGPNLMLTAHSMGGHLGLRYIHDHPDVFDRAVMMAPMLDFNTFDLPKFLLHGIVYAGQAIGVGNTSFGGDFLAEPEVCNDNFCSPGDRNRYEDSYYALRRSFGDAAARTPTPNWFEDAFDSIHETQRRGYLESIRTPILFLRGENDMVVDNDRIAEAARRIPGARMITLPAGHGLLSEPADVQYGLWQSQLDFLDAGRAPLGTGTRLAGTTPGLRG